MALLPDESAAVEAIERALPSVVRVGTLRLVQASFLDTFPIEGLASGIAYAPDRILTNSHVVEASKIVEVVLGDGRKFSAKVRGSDPATDVAVLEVPGADLDPLKLGDSDTLRVGQRVLAIGSPLGLKGGPTVTMGVVSALQRSVNTPRGVLRDLIQTDAAINPGSSGGPLLNSSGEAVGMGTAVVPHAQAIGFAVPINLALEGARQLVEFGRVLRPWLGLEGTTVDARVANLHDLSVTRGVLVLRVAPGSPASEAGLAPGDVILSVDGREASSLGELLQEVRVRAKGRPLEFTVARGLRKLAMALEPRVTPR